MNENRKSYLLMGFARNSLSAEERTELLYLLQCSVDDESLGNEMQKIVDELVKEGVIDEVPSQQIWDTIQRDPRRMAQYAKRRYSSFRYYAAAIAGFAMLIGGYFFYTHDDPDYPKLSENTMLSEAEKTTLDTIGPGTQQAMLRLPDGKVVAVVDLMEGAIVNGDGYEVYVNGGQIQYKEQDDHDTPLMMTLTTPRGGEYQTRLPDGTNVWLNANSAIRYPVRFGENTRDVHIEGEAYLEVHKDPSRPFTVHADQTTITVLGTAFNVSAYPEQQEVSTTLIEGSVRLQKGEATRQLYPGEQARVSKTKEEHITVQAVDIEEAIAWKNGYFYFNNEDMQTAMAKIARWYDVDIVYKSTPRRGLDGTISRMENLEQLLQALELTGAAKFKLEGRSVIVSE